MGLIAFIRGQWREVPDEQPPSRFYVNAAGILVDRELEQIARSKAEVEERSRAVARQAREAEQSAALEQARAQEAAERRLLDAQTRGWRSGQ